MKYTELDKYKDTKRICKKVGCNSMNMNVCCPELMGELCLPKKNLLALINIKENDLDKNRVTLDNVIQQII